jgi:hypothetical protein
MEGGNMLKNLCGFILTMALLASPAVARLPVDVDGVRFSGIVDAMDQRLHLHGAGILRHLVFIKAYAGALYLPDEGTTLSRNGESLGSIPGDDFARAVFSIWLGANPIDKNFRDLLLGGL